MSPPPRSTIAAAFSPDGELLASTQCVEREEADGVAAARRPPPRPTPTPSHHSLLLPHSGDHTVKVVSVRALRPVAVLAGHRRTPWVVRFHPTAPGVLASGSLDHSVRVWSLATPGTPLAVRDFGRPIASLAFSPDGAWLAVAAGHRLHVWRWGGGEAPTAVLRTRRSLRAVAFHPSGAPLLLTAEVVDPPGGGGVPAAAAAASAAAAAAAPTPPPPPALWPPAAGAGWPPAGWPAGGDPVPRRPSWAGEEAPGTPTGAAPAPPPPPRPPAPLPPAPPAPPAAVDIIGAEQPCAVRVRLWRTPPRWLERGAGGAPPPPLTTPALTLADAALCSEMGVHFSPCGRYLAVVGRADAGGYELRVVGVAGLAAARRGSRPRAAGAVLARRPVRAAHCLTSVQWSPTGEHILLAYGRRHASLLLGGEGGDGRADGDSGATLPAPATTTPTPTTAPPSHTVLEIYEAATLRRSAALRSAEHEVNAAAFHPGPGCGLVFGTKDGALCVLGRG